MKTFYLSIAGLFITLTAFQLKAVEPLSTVELSSHCSYYTEKPGGKDAIFCVRYIQGFIDGAIATDERVVSNLSKNKAREESFSERAIRTRLGNLKRYGSTYYADFCLGDTILRDVVSNVVEDLNNNTAKDALARNAVFKTLRKRYPCKNSKN